MRTNDGAPICFADCGYSCRLECCGDRGNPKTISNCQHSPEGDDAAMTPARYGPGMPTQSEMSAPMLGLYLRSICLTHALPALNAIAEEIGRRFPADEATPRLLSVIAIKATRLAEAN